MKSPDWLTGSAPMPKHECDKDDCLSADIRFHFLEKTGAVYKCCYVCWTSRAVSKREHAHEAAGFFGEFQQKRDEHSKAQYEAKKKDIVTKHVELLGDDFYNSREWLALRYRALEAHFKIYGHFCLCCHNKFTPLHVDHIKPKSKYPELALDPDNIQVLCGFCNIGKSNKSETDFREPA